MPPVRQPGRHVGIPRLQPWGGGQELAAALLDILVRFHPLDESIFGMADDEGRLPDVSEEAQAEEVATLRAVAQRAAQVDPADLDETARQTSDLVRFSASARAGAAGVPSIEFTVGDFQAAPVAWVLTVLPKGPLRTPQHQNAYLSRLEQVPLFLQTASDRHRQGVAAGRRPVRRLVNAAIAQFDSFLTDPTAGGLRRARPDDLAFNLRVDHIIDQQVRPALASYRECLATQLLDPGRDDEHCGLCHLPGGDSMYGALTELHTSVQRDPEALHHTGLEIAERIKDEYREIGARAWRTADFDVILDRLRNDPVLRYHAGSEILADGRAALARAEEAMPGWFGTLPQAHCLVEPMPTVEAESVSALPAYYMPAALDGSSNGTYFVNMTRATERSRADTEAVAFHESVPGHHLHMSIIRENPELSLARKVLHDSACVEGWAFYTERLADEMDLYSDQASRLGMLTAEMWRAGRLVVDTGIHLLGWSRQRAIDWFSANVPLPPLVIEAEVNRYITLPGQALSSMTGRLEIERLRRDSTRQLGKRFDRRAFHDVVLGAGPLPLAAMAGVVDRWVARTAASSPDVHDLT